MHIITFKETKENVNEVLRSRVSKKFPEISIWNEENFVKQKNVYRRAYIRKKKKSLYQEIPT